MSYKPPGLNCILNITQIIFVTTSNAHTWQKRFMPEKGEHVKFESFLAVILFISVSYFDVIANEDKKTHGCD